MSKRRRLYEVIEKSNNKDLAIIVAYGYLISF